MEDFDNLMRDLPRDAPLPDDIDPELDIPGGIEADSFEETRPDDFEPATLPELVAATIDMSDVQVEVPTETVDVPQPGAVSPVPLQQEAVHTESKVTLHDLVRALMSNDDPSRLIIWVEVQSFFSYLATVIDTLLSTRISFRQFRPFLDSRVTMIRDAGHPELARAVADDLDLLEVKLQGLQDFEAAGASSYIEAETETRLTAWRDARIFTGLEVQMQRDQVHNLELAVAETSSSVSHFQSCVAIGKARVAELEQELQSAKEGLIILQLTEANKEETLAVMSEKLELSKQKLAEIEKETANTLNGSEESFRAELQTELQQAFIDKVTDLKQQIRCHKFNV